jgi:hypothetical protein
MITGCIYAPNDKNAVTISFYENFFKNLEEKMHKFPNAKVVIAGDFNIPLYEDECSMRNFTKWEKIMATGILDNMHTLGLQDSYRHSTTKVGSEHTFKRPGAGIYSVIDRIITNFPSHDTTSSTRTWGLIPSDHAMLTSNFNLLSEPKKGPGLFKLNVRTLENDMNIVQIRDEFKDMLEGIPTTWTPHEILDFAKASFSGIVTQLDRKTKIKTTTLGEQLKKDLTYAHQKEAKVRLLRLITQIENEVEEFTNKQGEHLARITQTKWYNEGEKSNKYFLNIAKFRQLQKQITSITDSDGNKITSQDGIINYITEFYRELYSKEEYEIDKVSPDKIDEFFKHTPKLSNKDKEFMDSPITLDELTAALKSCKNSTPGPDGI